MYSFITYSLWVTDVTKKIEKTEEHITYILSFLEEFVKRVWVIVVKKHNEIGTVWRMEKNIVIGAVLNAVAVVVCLSSLNYQRLGQLFSQSANYSMQKWNYLKERGKRKFQYLI